MDIRGVLACDHASKAPFVADVRNLCAHNRDVKNSYRHTYFQRCAYLADHFDGAFEIRAIVVDDDSSVDEKRDVIFWFVRVVLSIMKSYRSPQVVHFQLRLPSQSFDSLPTFFSSYFVFLL